MAAEGDPLFDTLFRSTVALAKAVDPVETLAPADHPAAADRGVSDADGVASAAPLVNRGAHTRAGNAMERTRSALLDGARLGLIRHGTKASMASIATLAGVAKATLYNHFRTRDAVLSALLTDELARLEAAARASFSPDPAGLAAALAAVAHAVAENPVRAALVESEPAVLARISRIEPLAGVSPLWDQVRQAVTQLIVQAGTSRPGSGPTDALGSGAPATVVLDASGGASSGAVGVPAGSATVVAGSVEIVLRWLTSFVLSPASIQWPGPAVPSAAGAGALVNAAGAAPLVSGAGAAPLVSGAGAAPHVSGAGAAPHVSGANAALLVTAVDDASGTGAADSIAGQALALAYLVSAPSRSE